MNWRRWIIMLLGVVWITSVHAWTWRDGWKTRDQQAQAYFKTGDYAKAADVFQRSDWRATAAYRAQNYQQAAQLFAGVQTADGHYNAGNALAKMGQYQPAIAAYDQALQRDAHHADALFNKQIVEKMLKKQEREQSKQEPKQEPKQDSSQPNQASDPSSPAESDKPAQSPPKSESEAKQPKAEPKQTKQPDSSAKKENQTQQKPKANRSEREDQQAKEQWLRLIPDDPAYLLREKFMRDHLKRQQGRSS